MRHESGAGEGRRLSADTVAEGLRGLGLELDKEQVNAIRRLGAPQAMKSLVELGNYFQSTKNKKGDNNCYGFSKSLSSVAAPTSQGHSSTGAGDSMLVKDEQCEASSPSSSSQRAVVSAAEQAPSKPSPAALPVPAASEPLATSISLPVDAILRGVREKHHGDPYALYRKLQSHGGSREGVHRGLCEAGVPLNADDYEALLHTTHACPHKGGEVDVAALVRGVTGLPGGSTVGLGHDTRKDGADMRRSRTCRVERSLERHIHTFLQTRGPASVAALLPHDGDKSGYMDKERLVSVLTRDLGLRLSLSDMEAGLRRLPVNDKGQVAYLRLLHGGGHNKALKKGGLMGHTQPAAAAGERGWNGVCGNEVADRIGRMLRSRYGSVEHAFRVVLDSGESAAGGSSNASDPNAISKRDLRWTLAYLGMRLSDRNLDLLVSSLDNSPPPDPLAKPRTLDRQHVDLREVISLLEHRRHPSEVSQPLMPPPPPQDDSADPEDLPTRDVVHKNSSGRMKSIINCEGRVEGPQEWEAMGKGGWLGEMGLTRRERRFRERCSSAPPRCRANESAGQGQKQAQEEGEEKGRVAGVRSEDFMTNRRVLRRLYKHGKTVIRSSHRQSTAVRALLDPDASSRHTLDREATHAEIFGHHSHKGRAAPVPRPETVGRLMHLQDTMAQGNRQQLSDEKEDAHAVFGQQARRRHFRPHDAMWTLYSPRKAGEVVEDMGSAWCVKRRPQSALASSRGMAEVLTGRGSHAQDGEGESKPEGAKGAGKPTALRERGRNLRKPNPKRYEVCAPLAEPLYGIE